MTLLKIGTVLNMKWVILELIGRGGMGEVYRAHQLNLNRDVAVKVWSQESLEVPEGDEVETARSRFRREVKAMAQVHHPNVVQIFDHGSASIQKGEEEIPFEYLVMEYIPGGNLRFTMPEGGFHPREGELAAWIRKYFFPLLDGVRALHDKGVIHRDLKPENFLLDEDIPKIADFGLARSRKLGSVTESMEVVGTPPYMAPDHFYDFRRVDERGDVYSLGKVLFEAAEGRMPPGTLPFKSANLSKPHTPFFQALDRILQKATDEEKSRRLKSVGELRGALEEALDLWESQGGRDHAASRGAPGGVPHPRLIWAGIGVALSAVAAMAVWHLAGDPWPLKGPSRDPGARGEKPALFAPGAPGAEKQAARSILGRDGVTMPLIPAGVHPERALPIPSFYMDATQVSVSQFVDFLNGVKKDLTVESGVVRGGGEIWFLLGEGGEGDPQVIYEHNRFHVRDLDQAGQPVVRVTWYGAFAYARHFGKRLPTDQEWEYAAGLSGLAAQAPPGAGTGGPKPGEEGPSGRPEETHMGAMGAEMASRHGAPSSTPQEARRPLPSLPPHPQGLKGLGGKVREWTVRGKEAGRSGRESAEPKGQSRYSSLVMGASPSAGAAETFKKFSYPWEGFFDVGFRCVAEAEPG